MTKDVSVRGKGVPRDAFFLRRATQAGFTLVELVVLMTIIAILAAYAIPRFTDTNAFAVQGFHDELVSATRYAQRYAITSGCTVRITINAASYVLTTRDAVCGAGTPVQGPNGPFAGNAPPGVSITAGTGNYDFDALGDTASGGTITLQGSGTSISFAITAGSGFVDI